MAVMRASLKRHWVDSANEIGELQPSKKIRPSPQTGPISSILPENRYTLEHSGVATSKSFLDVETEGWLVWRVIEDEALSSPRNKPSWASRHHRDSEKMRMAEIMMKNRKVAVGEVCDVLNQLSPSNL